MDNNTQLDNDLSPESTNQPPIEPTLVTEFDSSRRKLTKSYHRTSHKYSIILMIISFLIASSVLILRITVIFRDFLIDYVSQDPIIIVGIFFTLGFVITSIGELPVSFYLHSKLSRKYGISKLSNSKWISRYFKGTIISFIIAFPLFEGFYWLLRTFPNTWWLWCTVASIGFTLVFSFLIPIVLLPLFFKFDPLEETYPELATQLVEMTENLGIKVTKAFNWKLGDIATVGNAGLLGIGATRRIIVADTILENYTTEEIKWILAHEIGHFKRHDIRKRIILSSMITLMVFSFTYILFPPLATFFGYSSIIGDVSGIPVVGLCFWIVVSIFDIPSLWYSRKQEAATDIFASRVVPDPSVAKSLFIKMADQNLAEINPPTWRKVLFMSHPSINERIENISKYGGIDDFESMVGYFGKENSKSI